MKLKKQEGPWTLDPSPENEGYMEFEPLVQKISFNRALAAPFFSGQELYAISVEGIMRNNSVKLF